MRWSKMPPDVQGLLGWFAASLVGGLCSMYLGYPLLALFFVTAGGYTSAQYDDGLYKPPTVTAHEPARGAVARGRCSAR